MTLKKHLISHVECFRLHPLGFYYCKIGSHEDRSERIHVWLADQPTISINEYHSHSYDISSCLLLGRMRSEIFEFKIDETGNRQEFAVTYEDNLSKLSRTGRSGSLVSRCIFDTVPNGSYFLPAGVVHHVKILEFPCVTKLTTIERGANILSYGDHEDETPFTRRPLDANEMKKLKAVLSSL